MDICPQICPLCRVTIDPSANSDAEVIFSTGLPSTRTRLWARVCQYAKNEGCINTDPALRSTPGPRDVYSDAPDMGLSGAA
ncbi:MAG: hypothetical protein CBD29_07765 [Synechococcus sp. TMED169]|nr:MAG: hypothetical protein CBD29_07765 [Synechococcus sp. TMED169]